jgi:hypothetical protein
MVIFIHKLKVSHILHAFIQTCLTIVACLFVIYYQTKFHEPTIRNPFLEQTAVLMKEQSSGENIYTQERGNNKTVEKTV